MARIWQLSFAVCSVVILAVSFSDAFAAPTGAPDFNHSTTGFPLTGGHATAVCETCHVGGVFKGTPRDCEGCHALGKRVVATPKSASHVVTDAPCDSCHFNTATFLGARYNHSLSRPESCATCHNGRIAQGRPASHMVHGGKQASDSCDHCHRTSAFLPSSWNHGADAPGQCRSCHIADQPSSHGGKTWTAFQCDDCHSFVGWSNHRFRHNHPEFVCSSCHDGNSAIAKTGSHTRVGMATYACDDCHASVTTWLPALYKHSAPSPTSDLCKGCHNNVIAASTPTGHVAIGTDDCGVCHTSTVTWLGALGAKPANHIPYNSTANCGNCHTGGAKVNVTVLHNFSVATYTCANCHITPNQYTGNNQKTRNSHDGSSGNNCTGCHEHSSAGNYGGW